MKPRDYCCCAIPMVNVGIYLTLTEQLLLALLVAILALATPSTVGAQIPSFAPIILSLICFVAAGIQVFGFLGVYRDKPIMFRRYTTIHIMITIAAFAVSAVWIGWSASKHTTAVSRCLSKFFSNTTNPDGSTNDITDEGNILCQIFTWVDIGLMSGLWVVLAIMQFYLYTVISSYGTGQREDYENFKSPYSSQNTNTDIPLTTKGTDPWDPQYPATGSGTGMGGYNHVRNESTASVSTILGEKEQQPREYYGYIDQAPSGYRQPQRQPTYASSRSRKPSADNVYPSYPADARTAAVPQQYYQTPGTGYAVSGYRG